MTASENLSPHQFVRHAVEELALGHPSWTGDSQPLHSTEATVHPRGVRFQRYPTTDSRVQSAIAGYSAGAEMPPVELVHRAGETMTADGHHRLSAAEHLGMSVPATITHSPYAEPYTGAARTGTKRKPRT